MAGLTAGQQRLVMRGSGRRRLLALDSMCFIYRFEANPDYRAITRDLFALLEEDECRAVTSVLALTECLVAPLRQGRGDVAAAYRRVVTGFPNLDVVPVSEPVATLAAELRSAHGLRTPDALHLATAIDARADAFVTSDRSLARLAAIEILLLDG